MTIMDQSGDYLTATEVATVLGLSLAQVLARVRSGAIPVLPPIVIPRAVLGIPRDAPVLAALPCRRRAVMPARSRFARSRSQPSPIPSGQ